MNLAHCGKPIDHLRNSVLKDRGSSNPTNCAAELNLGGLRGEISMQTAPMHHLSEHRVMAAE